VERQAQDLLGAAVESRHAPGHVDRDGAALEVGEDLLDEGVLRADRVEERDVLDRHGDLAGQREEPLEVLPRVRLAGHPRPERQEPDELGLHPERHRDLAAERGQLAGRVDPLRLPLELVSDRESRVLSEPGG
jgi:hypothetical protein